MFSSHIGNGTDECVESPVKGNGHDLCANASGLSEKGKASVIV